MSFLNADEPSACDLVTDFGLQYLKRVHGGALGVDWRSKSGLPVINIPGCPAHPDWMTQVQLAACAAAQEAEA